MFAFRLSLSLAFHFISSARLSYTLFYCPFTFFGRVVSSFLPLNSGNTSPFQKLLINSCEVEQFPSEACAKADEIFGGGKFTPGYKREYFERCSHGFSVHGDMSDPKVKAGKEGAFKAAVEWIKEHI